LQLVADESNRNIFTIASYIKSGVAEVLNCLLRPDSILADLVGVLLVGPVKLYDILTSGVREVRRRERGKERGKRNKC